MHFIKTFAMRGRHLSKSYKAHNIYKQKKPQLFNAQFSKHLTIFVPCFVVEPRCTLYMHTLARKSIRTTCIFNFGGLTAHSEQVVFYSPI